MTELEEYKANVERVRKLTFDRMLEIEQSLKAMQNENDELRGKIEQIRGARHSQQTHHGLAYMIDTILSDLNP